MPPYYYDAQYMETPYTWNGYVSYPDTKQTNMDMNPYLESN